MIEHHRGVFAGEEIDQILPGLADFVGYGSAFIFQYLRRQTDPPGAVAADLAISFVLLDCSDFLSRSYL